MFKKIISTILALLLSMIILPFTAMAGKTTENNSNQANCTVIIVIDGLQKNHLQLSQTPNIKGLINNGITAEEVSGIPHNITGAISLLLTGNTNTSRETVSKFYSNQTKNNVKTVFIDGTGGKLDIWTSEADIGKSISVITPQNIQQTIGKIGAGQQVFCIIALPRVNPRNLSATDNQIGFLLNHLRKINLLNNSIISITGTTGDPPLVLCGAQVKAGINVPIAAFQDIAATICFLNHQDLSGTGMVLYDVIEPDITHSQDYLLQQRIKDLYRSYIQSNNEIEQLRQEQQYVRNQQLRLDKEKAKYTTIIESQQGEIEQLKLKITLIKLGSFIMILLFIISLYMEYKFLKKRFMFFT